MEKKKNHYPKDMDELMDITYGTDYDKKKKYNDGINSAIISPNRESEVVLSVNPSLNIEKIKEKKNVKTPDFIVESESVFIEVTSINNPPIIGEKINPSSIDIPRKLSDAIEHIEEKDKLGNDDFLIGGVVFIDLIINTFTDIMEEKALTDYIQKSSFLTSEIDFLFVRADSANINGVSSEELYPSLIFVKEDGIKTKLNKIFLNTKIIKIF